MKSRRGIRGIAPPIFKLGSSQGAVGQRHVSSALPPKGNRVHIIQEVGWAPGSFRACVKKPSPSGFDPQTVQLLKIRYFGYALPDSCKYREIMTMVVMMMMMMIIIIIIIIIGR